MTKPRLDAIDIRILCAVQKHGQLSKNRLAEIVNLSPTPCWARLTRLKAAGFIRSFHADIALERVVDFTQVVVTVSLSQHRKVNFDRFEAKIMQRDEITLCVATGAVWIIFYISTPPALRAFKTSWKSCCLRNSGSTGK